MMTTCYDVVDRMTGDIIAVCLGKSQAVAQDKADRECEQYTRTYQRVAHVRKTTRPAEGKEWHDLMHLVRECRQMREERLAQHLAEVERKARRQLAA